MLMVLRGTLGPLYIIIMIKKGTRLEAGKAKIATTAVLLQPWKTGTPHLPNLLKSFVGTGI